MTASRGLDVYEEAGRIMGELSGWSASKVEYEIQAYKYEIRRNTECFT
jgi:hypothetical protein